MRNEFLQSLMTNQAAFGVELPDFTAERLADHYELILEHNSLLHLVGPCSPTEFATRHVLESLTMLKHLPKNASFADIGSGGGFPAIPCLIVRQDLTAVLIESKEKKAAFLRTAFSKCEIGERAAVVARQFSEVKNPGVGYISCRALDGFVDKLPKLVKWAGRAKFLYFGGPFLRDKLKEKKVGFGEELMPFSEQRFLFYSK